MTADAANNMPILGQLLPDVAINESLKQISVSGLTIDSRDVKPGYLFVAVAGLQSHGKTYADSAIEKGAVAILIDENESLAATIPVIKVAKLDQQLSQIAGRFYNHPSHMIPIIGVTGTNGKTTCTQLLAQAFAYLDIPCGVVGTLGYGLVEKNKQRYRKQAEEKEAVLSIDLHDTGMTTADAISTQKICSKLHQQGAAVIAMEVSSHGLAQYRVADIFIRTAVFTNLSHDHLDYHGSMAAYAEAKASLFSMPSIDTAIINLDDAFSSELIQRLQPNIQLVTYSLETHEPVGVPSSAHFSVKSTRMQNNGIEILLFTPEGEFSFLTQLVGQFNISNLLAVIASLYANRYRLEDIIRCLPLLKPISGRMDTLPNETGIHVVIDYAHTPDALRQALAALRMHTQGKLWCVFGCGGDRDREKRPKMASIAEQLADEVVLTSDNPRTESSVQIFSDIEAGFSQPRNVIVDRASAIEYAITKAQYGDLVLIAGKGHEDYQLIGEKRFPFSDYAEARLALRKREQGERPYD